jgi:hypothetical protein
MMMMKRQAASIEACCVCRDRLAALRLADSIASRQ